MDLKELLGEELYNQVIEKAGDHKLAIVSDGNWIPKEKFDSKNNEVKELKDQLKDRDSQLDELSKKAKGNEELTEQINQLKEQNETTKTEYEQKLQQQAFDHALDNALRGAKVRNPKAAKALLETESIKLDGDKLLGLEEQLTALKESDGYLFEQEEPPGLKGRKPNEGGNPPSYAGKNPFSKEHLNLTEQGRLFKEEPELAKQLQAQAKG